ncbi:sulfotransferase family 2 domain-containing protein [Enterovibrio calviensis]|uniref:sulfotransferase family 2 domain-containing protein n=1 Tax=Enterovibrio calviensis TaxID=91359 RepID=UPI0004806593|nr:sulfotransferase family 2 domain-containing protein [Enterovibrio calviensis]
MLISLHLPKTAGASFLVSLEDIYGEDLLRDYLDFPINQIPLKRKFDALSKNLTSRFANLDNYKCIHGHFLPLKYSHLSDATYITWMRDPIERLGSHYNYWIRTYNPNDAGKLHTRVVEEEWSFEKFCFSQEMRNFYAKFLWGFDVKRFDFIGITEHFDSDMTYFADKYLGVSLKNHQMNVNATRDKNSSYFDDLAFKGEVTKFHSKDVELYEYALKKRMERIG